MDDTKALTVVQHGGSLPAPVVSNEQWAKRRADFNQFVNTQLHKGTDYGEIPGTDKPTLLKPGAEKILQLYGCSIETETTHRDQDIMTGYLNIEVAARAVSIQSGMVVGVGLGSCSTYESKYRWRWEWWNGKGQPQGDDWEQTRGGKWRRRIENRDMFDQWNTVLKMAKKRAMVDLALTISGASEKFTQDVEDMGADAPVQASQAEPEPPPAKMGPNGERMPESNAWTRTTGQLDKMAEYYALTNDTILQALGVKVLTEYQGTKAAAKSAVEDWITKNVPAQSEPEVEALEM